MKLGPCSRKSAPKKQRDSVVADAARSLVGRHDFSAFGRVQHTAVRTLYDVRVRRRGHLVTIDVVGDRTTLSVTPLDGSGPARDLDTGEDEVLLEVEVPPPKLEEEEVVETVPDEVELPPVDVDVELPPVDVDVELPPVDVELPPVEVELPPVEVELDTPLDVDTPLEVETPLDVETLPEEVETPLDVEVET